jgi:hypothetical protein
LVEDEVSVCHRRCSKEGQKDQLSHGSFSILDNLPFIRSSVKVQGKRAKIGAQSDRACTIDELCIPVDDDPPQGAVAPGVFY